MDNELNYTHEELQLLYAACMGYGDKLAGIKRTIPYEDELILDGLADKAKAGWTLAKKIKGSVAEP